MASIRETEKGRWYAQIFLGKNPETGKCRFVSKTFDCKKAAKEWANKTEVQKDEGLYRPSLAKATLAGYLMDTWLPMHRTQVRSTYTIEMVLRKWICRPQPDTPFLGKKALRKLTVADFDKLYVAMAEKHGMQRRGIAQVHALLKRALKSAVQKGELPRNPAEFATLPKPHVRAEITCAADEDALKPVQYMEKAQAVRFLAAAKRDRWSALWHLLLDSGLRPGEAFALKWDHVDFEHNVVKVRGTLVRVRGEARKGRTKGWMVTRPKSDSSAGDVPLRATTMKELRLWQERQKNEREGAGAEWRDHGFVFTTPFGAPIGNNIGRAWWRVMREADGGRGDLGTWGPDVKKPKSGPTPERSFAPKFSMYVCRHTCATLLLLGGMPLFDVSRRLRHKNINITAQFYGHLKAADTTQAAEIFDRMFEPKLTLVA